MALSNTFAFTLNRDELIKKSMRILGTISADQSPTMSEVSSATNSLNLMLKAWQADGMQLWQVTELSIPPVEGQAEYTIGPTPLAGGVTVAGKPAALLEAYRRLTSNTSDISLIRQSRTQYWELNTKSTKGTPVNVYWELKQSVDYNSLYVWPAPDANFAANNTIEILYQKPFDDMSATDSDLAFPQEWELAVVYGLAVILAPEYGVPLSNQKLLIQQADKEKDRVLDWDQEQTSVLFSPEYNPNHG
jgi:hypothetical protein